MMTYYRLDTNLDDYRSFDFKDDTADLFLREETLSENWCIREMDVYNETCPHSDFVSVPGNVVAVSERAWAALAELLQKQVEALPISVEGRRFYAINVLEFTDCLQVANSKVRRNSSGHIMQVYEYSLDSEKVQDKRIFLIPETCVMETFVDDIFKHAVEESGLIGARFKEIKVRKAGAEQEPDPVG